MDVKTVEGLWETTPEKGILCVAKLRLESIYCVKKKKF